MPQNVTVRSLCRRAARQDLRLVKVPERSRHYWQYGPYLLTDADTSGVVAAGLWLDDVATELDQRATAND
jgi:hypothetical protein